MLELGERTLVDAYLADSAPRANCARSFAKLYQQDKPQAKVFFFEGAKAFTQSHS